MKRSRQVSYLLLGVAAGALAACGDDVPKDAFTSVKECELKLTPDECRAAFGAASAEHAKSAPRYASAAECEAATGNAASCQVVEQRRADGTTQSWFMPAMMGFMAARMLSGGSAMGAPGGGQAMSGKPLVVDRNGYYRPSGSPGAYASLPGGQVASAGTAASTADRVGRAPSTVTRGGFGGTASSSSFSSGS
ncbi:MAG: DUF1190 domain-containing protein [Alphaproteobacteria bacterium]|nr:DUF1190 domain-containing protein [Alphaproteobacteria bacterium]